MVYFISFENERENLQYVPCQVTHFTLGKHSNKLTPKTTPVRLIGLVDTSKVMLHNKVTPWRCAEHERQGCQVKNLKKEEEGVQPGRVKAASCPSLPPGLSRSGSFSLRLDSLWGFVNEMDALAPCLYITQLGFLLSSFPALLCCPNSPLFIRRLPRLQHIGVQLPSLSKSQESSAPSDAASLSLSFPLLVCLNTIQINFDLLFR